MEKEMTKEDIAGSVPGGGKDGPADRAFLRSFAADLLLAVILAAVMLCFIRPTIVRQNSMEDTFFDGDYLIMYRLAYKSHSPERGDVIIFQSDIGAEDGGKGELLIKRVVGLPGDNVKIQNGKVYINEAALIETYVKGAHTEAADLPEEGQSCVVPEDSYYCMGDNRSESMDSRDYDVGFVSSGRIKGKVVLRLFPLNRIQVFR